MKTFAKLLTRYENSVYKAGMAWGKGDKELHDEQHAEVQKHREDIMEVVKELAKRANG